MTKFIYNMQDELFHLNMILPVGEFSPIKKLADHIEAQGEQLRELNAAITKRNITIEKYEREKKDLQNRVAYLSKKVNELNAGIRDSEDLTWKQKYDALLHSSEQAIGALQKKCQEYKNDAVHSVAKAVHCPWGDNAEIISAKNARIKELEEKNKTIEENFEKLERSNLDLGGIIGLYVEEFKKLKEENEEIISAKNARIISLEQKLKNANKEPSEYIQLELVCHKHEETIEHLEKALEDEKQASKDLNVIINSKNKLLDEYMTKYNNLEYNYKEEVRMKEQFKTTCFNHERTIASQNSTIKYLKGQVADYIRLNAVLRGKLISIGEFANKIDDVILSEE